VPKDPHEKAMQRALMQYKNPKLHSLVEEALHLTGREDLIGYGPKCLIRPESGRRVEQEKKPASASRKTRRTEDKDRGRKGYRGQGR
jgi:hypothetical protein